MSRPPVALFDLDFTILDGDSEALWSQFLFDQNIVDAAFVDRIHAFYQDYDAGKLDIYAYYDFLLRPLTLHPPETFSRLRETYLTTVVFPRLRPNLLERVESHRAQGHILLLITAANDFIGAPIAEKLAFPHLICTHLERDAAGAFTGTLAAPPAFRQQKVTYLQEWLASQACTLADSWGYSDSYNDLPILNQVAHPVAVGPDERLAAYAAQNGWEIIPL